MSGFNLLYRHRAVTLRAADDGQRFDPRQRRQQVGTTSLGFGFGVVCMIVAQ